jgi:hypothetical protein
MELVGITTPLALAFFLALTVERLIEWFLKPVLAKIQDETYRTLATRLITLVLGGIVAFGFGLDLLTPLVTAAGVVPQWPVLGPIVTAIVVGGGSTLLHDLWPVPASDKPATYEQSYGQSFDK